MMQHTYPELAPIDPTELDALRSGLGGKWDRWVTYESATNTNSIPVEAVRDEVPAVVLGRVEEILNRDGQMPEIQLLETIVSAFRHQNPGTNQSAQKIASTLNDREIINPPLMMRRYTLDTDAPRDVELQLFAKESPQYLEYGLLASISVTNDDELNPNNSSTITSVYSVYARELDKLEITKVQRDLSAIRKLTERLGAPGTNLEEFKKTEEEIAAERRNSIDAENLYAETIGNQVSPADALGLLDILFDPRLIPREGQFSGLLRKIKNVTQK